MKNTYNSRNRPATISADGWSLELSYGSGLQREKTVLKQGNSVKRTTYHISKDCELDILPACTCSRYMDYIFADGKIVAIHVHNTAANADSMYYVQTDLLDSWDRIVDDGRSVVQSSHFDPWGNRMSASNWTVSQDGSGFGFRRGFTGHEHYDRFGIINMNARLYDPIIGRFFSPDPQVQNPYSTQGLNRYSYCGNNPVMNIDPDGEIAWWVIPVIIGSISGGIQGYQIAQKNGATGWKLVGYIAGGALVGAVAGVAGAGVGTVVSGAIGIGGMAGGAISGAAGGFSSGLINGIGMSSIAGYHGSEFWKNVGISTLYGTAGGAVVGGVYGGINSIKEGNRFWNGRSIVNEGSTMTSSSISDNKTPYQLGKEGEEVANLQVPKKRIESLTGTAKYRIPDGIDQEMHILYEVKNVSALGVTHQIEDFVIYCRANDYTFILYVRNEYTELSKSLLELLQTIDWERVNLNLYYQ